MEIVFGLVVTAGAVRVFVITYNSDKLETRLKRTRILGMYQQ